MEIREELVKIIARLGILSFGDYILANGIHTQYYLDFSLLANNPRYLDKVVDFIIYKIKNRNIDTDVTKLVGIMNKGSLLVIPSSIKMGKPFALFGKYENKVLIGTLDPNDKVLIIDDLISSGKTISRISRILKNMYKCSINKAVVILDREDGGIPRLKKMGINVYPLIKMSELIDLMYGMGIVGDEEKDIVYSEIKLRKRGLRR